MPRRNLGSPLAVLTSSGHSGRFAFGIYHGRRAEDESQTIDDGLDRFFGIYRRTTLLVNCLPIGVKVPTRRCILAGGVSGQALAGLPVLLIRGRGDGVRAAQVTVYPERIKEGLYLDPTLARQAMANFRLASGPKAARVRVQLARGAAEQGDLAGRFRRAMARYTAAPLEVLCQSYLAFGSGLALDYERKFDYLDDGA